MDWRHRALCRDEDPELFFPAGEEHTTGSKPSGPVLAQFEEAKKVCARCPVFTDCRAWAVDTGQPFGVSGGTTADERRALRRHLPHTNRPRTPVRGRPRSR